MSSVEKTVVIEGMSCGGCVASLSRVLKTVEGIEPLSVQVGKARLRIDTDIAGPDVIAKAVERAGFSVVSQE